MATVIGQPVTAWKLGATSPVMRARAGHDGAIIGRVFESVTFQSPAKLPYARFRDSKAECEFAFLVKQRIEARTEAWSATELAGRVELHAALEIIGNRYPKGAEAFKANTNDEIADNGAGVPEDLMRDIFEPFVTTKASGGGLGLSLVSKIIADHGGAIECRSEPGRTVFQIRLPVWRGEEASP